MPHDLSLHQEGPIAWLTLERPDYRNAYSEAMAAGLVESLARLDRDPAVRVIVLTGRGGAFSAGGDVKAMRDHSGMFSGDPPELRERYHWGLQQSSKAFESCETPIVAAVNGPAIGAGLHLACMCDIRIASDKAKFGATFVSLGLVPGDGGAYFLPRVVGFAKALEMALTARIVDAREAERIGLVSRVVPHDQLLDEARQVAERIASQAPIAVKLTKAAYYRGYQHDLDSALAMAAAFQAITQRTADHEEGVRALLESRPAVFTGH